MRIAHLNFLPNHMSGVNGKLQNQAETAVEHGLGINFIVLNTEFEGTFNNVTYIKLKTPRRKWARKLYMHFCKFSLISSSLDLSIYDILVMRYVNIDISAIRFVLKHGNKIVTEHHTYELGELKTFPGIGSKLALLNRYLLGPYFLRRVKGIIGVTQELLSKNTNDKFEDKSIVITNGIRTGSYPKISRSPKKDNETLVLIFVASFTTIWHGLDRVLNGVNDYNGDRRIDILVIGRVSIEIKHMISSLTNKKINVKLLGELNGDDLDRQFNKSDIAISSLALHRNGMKEACPLKTREYIARGIPFIYAYDDPDFDSDVNFAKKFPSNESAINIAEIEEFYIHINQNGVTSAEMLSFATNNLDYCVKIIQMKNFVQRLR